MMNILKVLAVLGLAFIFITGAVNAYHYLEGYFGFHLDLKDWIIIALGCIVLFFVVMAYLIGRAANDFLSGILKTFWG